MVDVRLGDGVLAADSTVPGTLVGDEMSLVGIFTLMAGLCSAAATGACISMSGAIAMADALENCRYW